MKRLYVMRLLLDTHIFITLINEDYNLEPSIVSCITDSKNEKFIGIASLWEIVIKLNIGKQAVTRNLEEMYEVIDSFEISVLDIQKQHFSKYLTLPLVHRDPFDRVIISQALADGLTLITDDQYIINYPNLIYLNQ